MSQEDLQVVLSELGRPTCIVSRGFVTGTRTLPGSTSRVHFAYRKDNGATLSITDEQSTTIDIPAGQLTTLYNIFSSTGTVTLQAANGTSESFTVRGVNGSNTLNAELIDISNTYNVPHDKAVLFVEGDMSVTTDSIAKIFIGNTAHSIVAGTPLSANSDASLFTIIPSESNITISGPGKVVIFDIF